MAKRKPKNKGKQTVKPAVVKDITNDIIAAAYSAATPPLIPVFIKVCRLCENRDGPFLNIFDADKVTAKKIDDLMPFSVTENDDLPHKICFRCSAKLEELYEFIQKCIKTQENLRDAVGKSGPFLTKSKMGKKLWEQKLNKTNMSNDDICDALIKKAMEGIKSIPPTLVKEETAPEGKRVTRSKDPVNAKKDVKMELNLDDSDDIALRQVKLALEKQEAKPSTNKVTRSSRLDGTQKKPEVTLGNKTESVDSKIADVQSKKPTSTNLESPQSTSNNSDNEKNSKALKTKSSVNNLSFDYQEPETTATKASVDEQDKKNESKKPFNIMDHISMINVNGVGILFQCKLCNRNFLKKEVVESHSCAKNGKPKLDMPKSVPAPEPPKVSTVKYIKIDSDMKKSLTEKIRKAEKTESEKTSCVPDLPQENSSEPKIKPKPKAGPASKTRRNLISDSNPSENSVEPSNTNPPISATPSVQFPTMPNLNGRFKLVPGPNNIFTLVEDTLATNSQAPPTREPKKTSRKRKSDEAINNVESNSNDLEIVNDISKRPEVIDLEDQSEPYPVGLFQTHSQPAPVPFTTPAMKKQSYTVVQTGNPSKLLISTKAKALETEVPKKRQKKTKPEVRKDSEAKEPFNVTLEDVAPPKDTAFFTFINVDPLLQPSYVLPTDNIIQESQISTSSSVLRDTAESKESKEKGKYTCNMCGETFSREKKLLAHIQSHYNKMDEEDQMLAERVTKKKGRK